MEIVALPLAGLFLVKPKVITDSRGFFQESYRKDALEKAGIHVDFVQDNHSRSGQNTVRGLHFQRPSAVGPGQAKLLRVTMGKVFDVAVDIRKGSPTFGQWHGEILDENNAHQLYVPVGFAHGFCVMSERADVLYKVSTVYDPATESGFQFDDAKVGVKWPATRDNAVLSKRDIEAKSMIDVVGDGV
jgi:dTDP-4-dehydrorhamnose 3,5-epimerase